jgi:predicted nucleic acid-binding protein
VREFILDASFALCWCFEDEATAQTESILTTLQNQEAIAWTPAIWRYEMLNGLGKGVARGRLTRDKALLFWQEVQALPVRLADVAVNETLLELALKYNLAVYDATYLSLAQARRLPLATVDKKLQQAAEGIGMQVIRP